MSKNLMFPRLARNFIKNGYFPTGEDSLTRILNAFALPEKPVRICDPCAGEGVAIAELAHALGRENVECCAVEYDHERATHAKSLVDRCIFGDLMDTIITRNAFGLLYLNPPYGDLPRDKSGNYGYEGKGRARFEKLFYLKTLPILQYEGILTLIIPKYVLDDEFIGWLTRTFADLRIYRAVETDFKQVVIFGRRVRQRELISTKVKEVREHLQAIASEKIELEVIPEVWPHEQYVVPEAVGELDHFYRVTLEPSQLAAEVSSLKGLWPDYQLHMGVVKHEKLRPACALSQWHLGLALAAGVVSGVVKSASGLIYVVKGSTHKVKKLKTEYQERDDGSMAEIRILTDTFVPAIRAWDMTPSSSTWGQLLTIR
jgi:hypothetical protein